MSHVKSHQQDIRTLLVEDSQTEAMLVMASLEEADTAIFHVCHALNLTEAITQLECEDYDVVVLDLTLPEASGIDTFTSIHDRFPEVPVVILTANGNKEIALKTVELGAQDYLIKEQVDDMQLSLALRYAITRQEAEAKQAALLEKLETVNRELESFANVISHDLKAPLRGIRTVVEWLVDDYAQSLDEAGREQMGLLINRVNRMQDLIDGVLRYSRAGRQQQSAEIIQLSELVNNVIDNLNPPEHITIDVEHPLPVIRADETRIMQIFQNLISNAIKYMDKPQGHLRITSQDTESAWQFNIIDNGPGIEPRHFERIFEMFSTLQSRDDYESSGVGLAVVKKIIETSGGRIWVQSQPSQGSTFSFTLPKLNTERP